MIDITHVLIGLTALFGMVILLRSIISLKICALCVSVSLTWLTLLVLLFLGYEINPVLVGILMGGSIVGVMYLLEEKLPNNYQLFKLPFFLTLLTLAYLAIEQTLTVNPVVVLAVLWVLVILLHLKRDTKGFKALGRKIIECCKNW